MFRRILSIIIIINVVIAFLGCKKSVHTDGSVVIQRGFPEFTSDKISPDILWKRITEDEPYTKYQFWPNHKGMQVGVSPHGRYHKIYINKIISDALPITDGKIPDGGIVVKENYNSNKELVALTVMAKINGYNPKVGDWYWGKYSLKTSDRTCGSVPECIECHMSMKKNDYLFIHSLTK